MKIRQFRYSVDNFGYVLYGRKSAGAVDGGAVDDILAFTAARGLRLAFITCTHGHGDHTVGNKELIRRSRAPFLDSRSLLQQRQIELESETIEVIHTPGHTADSVCFHCGDLLVTGDTLFNGTVGNCFSGDLSAFYHSIKRLMALDDDTRVYAGHDYVRDSMAFAKSLQPDNRDIDAYLEKYDPAHLVSTLAQERRVNPYLKFNDPEIVAFLERRGLPVETELQRWESLMSIE